MLFAVFLLAIVLTAAAGVYSIISTRNLIRVLIAMELVGKSALLLLMLAGSFSGQMELAEAFAIVFIIAETVVTAIGAVLCIAIHAKTGSLDISYLAKTGEDTYAE